MYEAASYAPLEQLRHLADRCLEDVRVEVPSRPETALLMVRVGETVDGEAFNLGEVMVTCCEVELDGEPGWGMVLGDEPERALCAAVLDAASRSGLPDGVEGELRLQLAFVREARRERWAKVRPTRVEFEEMPS